MATIRPLVQIRESASAVMPISSGTRIFAAEQRDGIRFEFLPHVAEVIVVDCKTLAANSYKRGAHWGF